MQQLRNALATCVAFAAFAGPFACGTVNAADDKKPNIVVIMGDDIGMVEHRRLSPGHDGRQDAEPRQARQGGHAVHRLLRRGELHGGPREFHHR